MYREPTRELKPVETAEVTVACDRNPADEETGTTECESVLEPGDLPWLSDFHSLLTCEKDVSEPGDLPRLSDQADPSIAVARVLEPDDLSRLSD